MFVGPGGRNLSYFTTGVKRANVVRTPLLYLLIETRYLGKMDEMWSKSYIYNYFVLV